MDLSFLLVADYASVTADGKMYMMGVFNAINALNFPTIHPDMSLVVQLLASPHESGRNFNMTVRLVDEDAQEIMVINAGGVVPQGIKGRKVTLNNVIKLVGVTFPRAGTYEFSVLIDNDHKGDLALDVVQIPTPA